MHIYMQQRTAQKQAARQSELNRYEVPYLAISVQLQTTSPNSVHNGCVMNNFDLDALLMGAYLQICVRGCPVQRCLLAFLVAWYILFATSKLDYPNGSPTTRKAMSCSAAALSILSASCRSDHMPSLHNARLQCLQ